MAVCTRCSSTSRTTWCRSSWSQLLEVHGASKLSEDVCLMSILLVTRAKSMSLTLCCNVLSVNRPRSSTSGQVVCYSYCYNQSGSGIVSHATLSCTIPFQTSDGHKMGCWYDDKIGALYPNSYNLPRIDFGQDFTKIKLSDSTKFLERLYQIGTPNSPLHSRDLSSQDLLWRPSSIQPIIIDQWPVREDDSNLGGLALVVHDGLWCILGGAPTIGGVCIKQ